MPMQIGSSGKDVAELQRRLVAVRYDIGKIDGIFGPRTRASVESFQRSEGYRVTGIVDARTETALRRATASASIAIKKKGDPRLPTWTVSFFPPEGEQMDYRERQLRANEAGVALYVEHHFNSVASGQARYSMALVPRDADQTSIRFADIYTDFLAERFRWSEWDDSPRDAIDGVTRGGFGGRGDGNLSACAMPCALLEPCFISNEEQARTVATEHGREMLARCLVDAIKAVFPEGAHVGFSVGHKYKASKPNDRGADLHPAARPVEGDLPPTEADLAEDVLKRAARILAV